MLQYLNMQMQNKNEKSSIARNVSIGALLIIVPLWLFYISVRYRDNISTVTERDRQLEEYLGR